MTRLVSCALALTVVAAACSKKKSGGEEKKSTATSSAAVKNPKTAVAKKPTPTEATAAKVREEATALLAGWTDAQNKGDFAGYKKLYQPHFFRGVKRTTSGKVARLDYQGWINDRGRMFKKPVEVAAEELEIKTWLDDGVKLKPGVTALRFVQRWKSGTYADHGVKIVHVWRDPKGRQRIVYEDLVNAEKGWKDEVVKAAAIAVETPKNDKEALTVWKSLAVTGANYNEKLGGLPDDDVVTGALARALVAGGNFECTKINSYDECGEEYSEWEPIEAKATFDDPCLRRRLAGWALDQLSDKDAEELVAHLIAMAAVKGPDDALVEAAIEKAMTISSEVAVKVVSAAAAADHDEQVKSAVEASDDQVLLTAMYADGVTVAGEKLAELIDADGPHIALLLEIAVDDKITVDTRGSIVEAIAEVEKKGVSETLHAIADDDDCGLSMAAAEALAERGDKSALPVRADTKGDATGELCMLLAGESDYAAAEAAKFFAKEGVAYTEIVEGDDYPEYDDDGNEIEEEEPEEEEDEEPTMIDQADFEALDPFNDDEVDFDFKDGKDGKPVVDSVTHTRWVGCGC